MPNELTALKAAVEALPASEDWHGTCDAEDAICKLITAARACVDAGKLEFTGSPSLWHGDNFTMIRIDRVLTDDEVAGVCRVLDAGDADAKVLASMGIVGDVYGLASWAARNGLRQYTPAVWQTGLGTKSDFTINVYHGTGFYRVDGSLVGFQRNEHEQAWAAFQAAIGGE